MDTTIIKALGDNSPAYVFDEDRLIERVNKIKGRLGRAEVCFAIKANPFLIKSLDNHIEKYEVCSPGELKICVSQNIDMKKIVLSGVNKQPEDIGYAMSIGVRTFTIESLSHLNIIQDCAADAGIIVNSIIRLSSGNQFGCDKALIKEILNKSDSYPNVSIHGVQYYSGTQKKGSKIREEIEELSAFCLELNSECGAGIDTLEYGPGLPIEYYRKNDSEEVTFEEFAEALEGVDSSLDIVIEMGRFLSAECGSYITKVIDVKHTYDKTYCIVDGGINHVNYYGQVMGARIPPVSYISVRENDEIIKDEFKPGDVSVCGSLCTTADILLRDVDIENVQVGDYFIFDKIGAYSVTEGIYLFLSRKLPKIYVKCGNEYKLVRDEMESYGINCPNVN